MTQEKIIGKRVAHPLEILAHAYEQADEEGRKRMESGIARLTYGIGGANVGLVVGVAEAILVGFAYQESPGLAKALSSVSMIGSVFLGIKCGEHVYDITHKISE